MSKVEQYESIRVAKRDDEGVSVRELARRFGVHRRDVRQALTSAQPPSAVETPVRLSPVFGDHEVWIRQILVADRDVHPKQRHTAVRVRARLAEERGVIVSESRCREVVARLRREIATEFAVSIPPWTGHLI